MVSSILHLLLQAHLFLYTSFLPSHAIVIAIFIALIRRKLLPVATRLRSKRLDDHKRIILDSLEELAQNEIDQMEQIFRRLTPRQGVLSVQNLLE
jgi:hypothetical protein